ncbi:MAG TPA: thioredoxin domain-containing protein [Candidatus Acidoferrum sp.]|nr:thioredoxin domain-containing protein [Candidatus Acidoferrum sp.]
MSKALVRLVRVLAVASIAVTLSAVPMRAQTPSTEELKKKVDAYLRNMFAFGPDVKLAVGNFKESGVADLLETTITVTIGENKEDARMWVSKDGKYLLRGEMVDMSKDGFAENRAKLDLKAAPVTGNPNATVTIVEFADFECPVCRQLHEAIRGLLPKYPQARLVFKDFPLEQVHPWARTGALAGRCAYQQDSQAFWKVYDNLYDNQDLISAANAWDKAVDYAGQAGLKTDVFKSCMTSPEATAAVDASIANGKLMDVNSTPTLFVNGRRMVGADPHQLEQLIQYELQHQKKN